MQHEQMILTESQRELREQMEIVAYRCLHAIVYFDGVTGKDGDFWRFTQNCYGEIACLNWCHLFNSRNNDPVHYWKLFGEDRLADLGEKYSYDEVKARFLNCAGLNEKECKDFRISVVDFRNKFTSHREYKGGPITFPRLEIARLMCLEMRNLLEDTVKSELLNAPHDLDLEEFLNHFKKQSNNSLLKKCEQEVLRSGPNAA